MAEFYKLHGAGNDFIFFEGKPFLDIHEISALCSRGTGIGADGLIFIEKDFISKDDIKYPFRMHYYNSDGKEADFCGNGARCSVLLAYELGYFEGENDDEFFFIARDGVHNAQVLGDLASSKDMIFKSSKIIGKDIKIQLINPNDLRQNISIDNLNLDFVNTGVEHSVVFLDSKMELDTLNIYKEAKKIRHDSQFAKGTNVNFVFKDNENNIIYIRTFEKGVEDETLACGTGISAAGYIDMLKKDDYSKRTVLS